MPAKALLGGLSAAEFLSRHWQKSPLLVRGAVPAFADPITPEELAGLACEAGTQARLILEQGRTHPWEVRHGPFVETDFTSLPDSHWTLLVQDVNRWVPALAELLEAFDFIPQWRIDDVMVSFAPASGSVGPHVDAYDVFLLQGRGRRRWQIDTRPVAEADLLPDLDLRILARFEAEQEWVLETGDMLYLPPGVAHYGVAIGDCLTYSVGFRAPAQREMLTSFIEHAASCADPEARYADAALTPAAHPGEITGAALRKVRAMIRSMALTNAAIDRWFGTFITEPPSGEPAAVGPDTPYSASRFAQALLEHGVLYRSEHARFAFIRTGSEGIILFIDGQEYPLDQQLVEGAALLCDRRRYEIEVLQPYLQDAAFVELVLDLVNNGYLHFHDEHG